MRDKESVLIEIKNTHLLLCIEKGRQSKSLEAIKLKDKIIKLNRELKRIEDKEDERGSVSD